MSDDDYDIDLGDENNKSKDKIKPSDIDALVICNIMKTQDGRDFMWRKLCQCRVFENIFSKDTIMHSYNSGLREFGVKLDKELKAASPSDYLKMIKENM
jgi:hypothetical protein